MEENKDITNAFMALKEKYEQHAKQFEAMKTELHESKLLTTAALVFSTLSSTLGT